MTLPNGDTRSGGGPATERPDLRQEFLLPSSLPEHTGDRLLVIAEELFAQRGIDGVSVRMITSIAECNPASIHHHFGSKLGLANAVLERRAAGIEAERTRLLADSDRPISVRRWADIWTLPLTKTIEPPPRRVSAYLGFVNSLQLAGRDYRRLVIDRFGQYRRQSLTLLEEALPDVPDDERELRFDLVAIMSFRALAGRSDSAGQWSERTTAIEHDDFVLRLIEVIADVLTPRSRPAT